MPIELLEKVRQYRQWLVRGDINRIAAQTRYSTKMVYNNLVGDNFTKDIVIAVREKARENARAMGVELN